MFFNLLYIAYVFLLYIKSSYSWVEQSQAKCFFLLSFKLKLLLALQLAYSYIECTSMQVGLHRIIMQTLVTRINIIQCLVDLANQSDTVVSLLAFWRPHIYSFSVFLYTRYCGVHHNIHLSIIEAS